MSTEIDEDDVIGPTIWEAAAEEEKVRRAPSSSAPPFMAAR